MLGHSAELTAHRAASSALTSMATRARPLVRGQTRCTISSKMAPTCTFCPCMSPHARYIHPLPDAVCRFRVPLGWQYLVGGNKASTSIDESYFAKYDAIVQAVISNGAYAIVDVHNYARWDNTIIGQGGPSNQDVGTAHVFSGVPQDQYILTPCSLPTYGPSWLAVTRTTRTSSSGS